jgi:hypothetical protein
MVLWITHRTRNPRVTSSNPAGFIDGSTNHYLLKFVRLTIQEEAQKGVICVTTSCSVVLRITWPEFVRVAA